MQVTGIEYRPIRRLALALACGASSMVLSSVALAQEAPVKRTVSDRDEGATTLGEVLVTARRVEENLLDVPVAITAIGADDLRKMASNPIVFAMSNPNPEIRPELAKDLVAVMATGRSDYPNQINNVLAFPGIFRGALDAGATDITENMKVAAAEAIASAVSPEELRPGFIIPSVFDTRVAELVAAAVAKAAVADGVCRDQV